MSSSEEEIRGLRERAGQLETLLKERDAEITRLRPFLYMADENRISLERDWVKATADVQVLQKHLEACPRYWNRDMMCVRPCWHATNLAVDDKKCFLLMPFSKRFDKVWEVLKSAANDSDMSCERADVKQGRDIMDDVWEGICTARVLIADLTLANPNVTYEIGLADVLGKSVVLICQTTDPRKLPFDFLRQRLIKYRPSRLGLGVLEKQVADRLKSLTGRLKNKAEKG